MSTRVPSIVRKITTLAQLDSALADSSIRPVLIFKHSVTCGMSLMAAEEVAELLDAGPVEADIHVVDVGVGREVSRAIEDRLKIRHESPQVLLIRNGAVLWHRSHAGVTAAAIARALKQLTGR